MDQLLKSLLVAALLTIIGKWEIHSAANKVLTTIYPVYVVAKDIGQSVCDVENFIPEGVSPHDYQIKPGDLAKIHSASVVFLCGLGLDNWFNQVVTKSMGKKIPQRIVITKGMEHLLIYDPRSDNKDNNVNPHFWLDPVLMKHVATNITMALKELFPDSRQKIEDNLRNFSIKMDELDKFIQEELKNINKRPIICLHNAFSYFAKRYDLEIAGIIEEIPDHPSSPQHIAKLISIARHKNVCAVFGETGASNEIAKRLSDELKLPFSTLDTLESSNSKNEDYVKRMKSNVLTIKKFMK